MFPFCSEEEWYDVTRTYAPHEQYLLKCLGHKYLRPKEEVPDEVRDSVLRTLQPKPVLIENSKTALQEIKEKFPLEKVEKKTKKFRRYALDTRIFDFTVLLVLIYDRTYDRK